MVKAVVFDLGGTLITSYSREEFDRILREAMVECSDVLSRCGGPLCGMEEIMARAGQENHESPDYRTRPLEQRLCSIFDPLGRPGGEVARLHSEGALIAELCEAFLRPISNVLQCYDDSRDCLVELKKRGLKTAVLTNTPWGSPAGMWKREIERHGLDSLLDVILCCRDVGWRKPARQPFDEVARALGVLPGEALMVGDSIVWDVEGARAAGMMAVHVDRERRYPEDAHRIASLRQLCGWMDGLGGEVQSKCSCR
jgi:putative hydrolase of the HAD superfamily